jgi:hypothetical protein
MASEPEGHPQHEEDTDGVQGVLNQGNVQQRYGLVLVHFVSLVGRNCL